MAPQPDEATTDSANNNTASSQSPSSTSVGSELAQALKDLARGEQTADALEADLAKLESKLDSMLEALGVDASALDEGDVGVPKSSQADSSKTERKS